MAGFILIFMGLAKFGSLIKFIPYPVVVGFTSGISLLIFSTQIKDFFGLSIAKVPSEFHEKWFLYFQNFSTINYYVFGIALLSLVIMILWPKVTHRIPGSLIAIIISTILVQYFNLPVDTIGSRFGEIPSNLPSPSLLEFHLSDIKKSYCTSHNNSITCCY